MELDRRILVFDGPGGELQQLALDLIGRDFEVHYANDLDEAQLLACEAKGQISAVLFTADLEIQHIPELASRFGVTPDALIPVGVRPPKRVVAALAHHGVRWHLWDDPEDASIRFVISGVLHDHDPFELRYHLRVPMNFSAHFALGDSKSETTIRDVGLGGACLQGGNFGEQGSPGEIVFSVDDQEVCLQTRTAWLSEDDNPALSIAGVSFQEIDPEAGKALDSLIASVVSKHQIQKPG